MNARTLLMTLALAVGATAQVRTFQITEATESGVRPLLDVRAQCLTPGPDGLGFARIEIDNLSPSAQPLRVATEDGMFRNFAAHRTLTVAPHETARLCLPVAGQAPMLEIRYGSSSQRHSIGDAGTLNGTATLYVGHPNNAREWSLVLVAALPPVKVRRGSAPPAVLPTVSAYDLPPDPRWLSGFHLLIVDATTFGLGTQIQELLVHYVAAGGALLLCQGEGLPAGPLATMAATDGKGRHGLGLWFRTRGGADDAPADDLHTWLHDATGGPALASGLDGRTPARAGLYHALTIPGLGEVPVWAFLFLILGFLAFVVHQMVRVVRKRMRPLRMLVVLPVSGIGFAVLILGYGLLSEGFSIRGIQWSFTRLDQVAHTFASVGTRTLYAGLSPGGLTPAPETLLLSERMNTVPRGGELRLDLDHGSRVDGAILPSRTPQTLVTNGAGRARERLRFKRRADGTLEVLAGPELRPCPDQGAVLVCDFAGQTYRQTSPGILAAADNSQALLERAAQSLAQLPVGANATPAQWRALWLPQWLRGQLGTTLTPGTYLAWVETPPAYDSLGITADTPNSVHLVLGTLAKEDILD